MNTDEYEGHTPGPWTLEKVEETNAQHEHYLLIGNDNLLSAIHHGGQEWDEHESNAQLIADAPLLLAEVKRLRRVINDVVVDLTMMRLDDNQRPQFEDAVRAATETLSEVIDVD